MDFSLDRAIYYAPRGRARLTDLGACIAQRYLYPNDQLIGLIGDAGAGKSLLIRGMFPGLVPTNDDDGVYVRPLPILDDYERSSFTSHTYHADIRFEMAFTQPWKLADAISEALHQGKRVVVEHFDVIYPFIKENAQVLIGIGEEVIVTRPSVFGPFPREIMSAVYDSLKYRKMAHSAEDLTSIVLEEMGLERPQIHGDVKRGFVMEFREKPDIDLCEVERRVKEYIDKNYDISYCDDGHINIGSMVYQCSGPRIHVRKSGEIEGFRLSRDFKYSPISKLYLLSGLVGEEEEH